MGADKPKKKPAAGWYADPKLPVTRRYWDGEDWTEQRYVQHPKGGMKPDALGAFDRPGGIIVMSLALATILGILAGVIYSADESSGVIAFVVAGTIGSIGFQIGIIAKGVELGIRAARHRPDLDF
jgi:hypothetical protein